MGTRLTSAQRGPGLASRQRPSPGRGAGPPPALNEGRDSRPGNGNQRAGGGSTTGTTLNEGRDSRPGNGGPGQRRCLAGHRPAQRGPGLASRQRVVAVVSVPFMGRTRSTRAGTRVPATDATRDQATWGGLGAQRGPGLASRQRGPAASQSSGKPPRALNEGRDSRPGNGPSPVRALAASIALAQRGPGLASRQRPSASHGSHVVLNPLNEGRDSRPGNGTGTSGDAKRSCSSAQRGPGLASRQRKAKDTEA